MPLMLRHQVDADASMKLEKWRRPPSVSIVVQILGIGWVYNMRLYGIMLWRRED